MDALQAGLSDLDLAQLDDYENSGLTDKEKAALRLADRMALTNTNAELDASLHAELSNYFTDAEISELSLVMGILSGMAKFYSHSISSKKKTVAHF